MAGGNRRHRERPTPTRRSLRAKPLPKEAARKESLTQWLAAEPSKKKQFPLLDLPVEVRMEVYKHLLPNMSIPAVRCCHVESPVHLSLRSDGDRCYPQLLRTCRLVYAEASSLMYDVLEFRIAVTSGGIFFCGGQALQGWKQFKKSIQEMSQAKKYLGERWTLFTRAKNLCGEVYGDIPWDWDSFMEVSSEEGQSHYFREDALDEINAIYEVKANVQLLADVLRTTGAWRKQQGLSAPKISIKTNLAVVVDCIAPWEVGSSRWLLEPLSDARGCEVVNVELHEDSAFCDDTGEDYFEEMVEWDDELKESMAGDPALFIPDPDKRRMQDQLNRAMQFMGHVGFGSEAEPLWYTLHTARGAFYKRDKKLFVEQLQSLVRRWNEVLKEERRKHRRAAPGFAAVIQSLEEE